MSLACRYQVVPDRTNTNAAPVNELLARVAHHRGRPGQGHRPAEGHPIPGCGRGWSAWPAGDQVVPDRTNTYAAPVIRLPTAWDGAPTTTVNPGNGHRPAERCHPAAAGDGELGLLGPGSPRPHEHIRRPGLGVLERGACHCGGPGNGHRGAELVPRGTVGGGQLGLLDRRCPQKRREGRESGAPPPAARLAPGRRSADSPTWRAEAAAESGCMVQVADWLARDGPGDRRPPGSSSRQPRPEPHRH